MPITDIHPRLFRQCRKPSYHIRILLNHIMVFTDVGFQIVQRAGKLEWNTLPAMLFSL